MVQVVDILNAPLPTNPIVEENGTPTQPMRNWIEEINIRSLIISTGSPEGVISARQGQEYMASDGAAGAIRWVKRDNDDGAGDTTIGWIAY